MEKYHVVIDTEFTVQDKIIVDSVQLTCPELAAKRIIPYPELSPAFNPFTHFLEAEKALQHLFIYNSNEQLEHYNRFFQTETNDRFNEFFDSFSSTINELIDDQPYSLKLKKEIRDQIEGGIFDELLTPWGLSRDHLKIVGDRKTEFISVELQPPALDVVLLGFFLDADLFKSFGKQFQFLLFDSALEKRRVIKVQRSMSRELDKLLDSYHLWLDGTVRTPRFSIRDVMHRIPPREKGLADQCRIFHADFQKIDIETEENRKVLKTPPGRKVIENMSRFREKLPDRFNEYAEGDLIATWALNKKQGELMNGVRKQFDLEEIDIKDTCGSNVAAFLIDLMKAHYAPNGKEEHATLTRARHRGNVDYLNDLESNDFGIQTFRTVGGLLYTRMAEYPYLQGYFGDLDLDSCYATKLSNMSIYLGCPITTTFKNNKPLLKEVIEVVRKQGLRRDAWFCRVSGKLEKAINTLILSDLNFKPKRIRAKSLWSINPHRETVMEWDSYKYVDPDAQSTLLLKEVIFGLLNQDIFDCLTLLPPAWLEEFLNLKVDAFVFVPNELICGDVTSYAAKEAELSDEDYQEQLLENGLKVRHTQYYRDHVCLEFPIKDYIAQIKAKRAEAKAAKDPIQEILKLINNSSYGALACQHLGVNNMLAANMITASARSAAWLMMNALNGFQAITDGCTFSWENIPVGQIFRDILRKNPWYVADYEPTVQSNLPVEDRKQKWINEHFREHMFRFYSAPSDFYLIQLYGYELKKETFYDSTGKPHPEMDHFTEFVNSNAGNYSKGYSGSSILIDGHEYDFQGDHREVKARSFYGKDGDLLAWYLDALKGEYKQPFRYHENQIIKFGEGNKKAIRYLKEEGIDEIVHPMGTSITLFKIMKLISRSQFLFLNKKQLRCFEAVAEKLSTISRQILTKQYWAKLKSKDLEEYGLELLPGLDYFEASKDRAVGVGFEVLCLTTAHKGSVDSVRKMINKTVRKGNKHFNAYLHLDRNTRLIRPFSGLFTATIVARANEEERLKQLLLNSKDEPTVLTVRKEHIHQFESLFYRDGE